MVSRHAAVLLACGMLMVACNSVDLDWSQAETAHSIAGYQSFLSKYPNGPHADVARSALAALQNSQAWALALATNTPESFQQYLKAQPNGANAAAARERLITLERASAWKEAERTGTAEALQAFLNTYSQGPEADQARQNLNELTSGFRVQLAEADNEQAADREGARLKRQVDQVLNEIVILPPDSSKSSYRVVSKPMNRSDADAACATLKRSHQRCGVVKS